MHKKLFFLSAALCSFLLLSAQNDELWIQGTAPKNHLLHTVAAKENFYSIGRMYNAPPKELAAFNGLTVDKGIAIGQKLKIPLKNNENYALKKDQPAADELLVPIYYTVKEHEGLYRIAVNNGQTLAGIKQVNNLAGDEIATGKKLVVGYLLLKKTPEATARFGGNTNAVKPPAVVSSEEVKKPDEKKTVPPTVVKEEPAKKTPMPAREYAKMPTEEEVKRDNEEAARNQRKAPVPPVQEEQAGNLGEGFFKPDYVRLTGGREQKTSNGTSSIFKTISGWQDGKYYALIDGVEPGNIIQVTNPANGKTIYAKVLGEMQELRQNHGLLVRISNAAANALNAGNEKFDVVVKY
ncbi:MAG: LysM peptidoglycan-binding domain-containing protein [Dinghuibacter sp.]|nr:LysM peptidoglycan-binding domain-containing protein [Dinghuibacter sp.]